MKTNSKESKGRACLIIGIAGCLIMTATGFAPPEWTQDSRQQQPNTDSPIGTWRGQSKCLVRPSGCRDEDSVYRVAPVAQSRTRVTLAANKVVDGREVNMGTGECSYSPEKHVLNCPLPNGSAVRFEQSGDSLSGTMTLPDGTAWRKIILHRASG